MLNFCVFVFIIYAVAGSVKTILFGSAKAKHKPVGTKAVKRQIASAKIIRLSQYRQKKYENTTYRKVA